MSVKTLLVPENGGQVESPPDTLQNEYSLFHDYTNGQERIIGVQCLVSSLGFILYIEDDPKLVRAFIEGQIEPPELFDEDNAIVFKGAGEEELVLPIWNREAKCASLVIKCTLDDPNILN